MPITLPNLDDRRYADLIAEARSLIPTYTPEWTDHNESDPGITLIELFAYLTEMLLYRLNRVTDANLYAFLKLLNPDFKPARGVSLEEQVRATVLSLREVYRAVTCADFERLAHEASERLGTADAAPPPPPDAPPPPPDRVGRAHCVPRRNLELQSAAERAEELPNHVSVIIVPQGGGNRQRPSQALLDAVAAYLDERRLVTSVVHVVEPRYVDVTVQATIILNPDVLVSDKPGLRPQFERAVRAFFDPLKGGPEGKGWPFGRNVYVSEIYEILDRLPGVDYVRRTEVRTKAGGTVQRPELFVGPSDAGRLKRNADNERVAVEIRADELVSPQPVILFPEDEALIPPVG
jgi:Baseplate J-like protein